MKLNRERPNLPPAELIECAPIRKAAEAYVQAKDAARKASQDAYQLGVERDNAVEADRQLYADALEKGKKDPGTPATDAHDEKLHAAQRRAEASSVVVERALDALSAALDEHEAAWAKQIQKQLTAARREWSEALDVLGRRREELGQALALSGYVRDGRWKPAAAANAVDLSRSGNRRASADAVFDALRELGESRERPQPVGDVQAVETTVRG